MAARQRKDIEKERIHVIVPVAWLAEIDAKAARLGISRSSFIAAAAYDATKIKPKKRLK